MSKDKLELQLVHAIIRDGYRTAIDAGFKQRVMLTETGKECIDFIHQYYNQYGVAPSMERLTSKFKDLVLPGIQGETVASLIADLNSYYTDRVSRTYITDILRQLNAATTPEDKKEAVKVVRSLISKYSNDIEDVNDTSSVTGLTDDDFSEEYLSLIDTRSKSGGLRGIPYAWPTITEHTLGIDPTHLVVFIARPKTGKTFVLGYQAASAWTHIEENFEKYADSGKTDIVFISNEVTTEEMVDRIVSSSIGMTYKGIRSGSLSSLDRDKLQMELEKWKSRRSKFKVIGTEGMGIGGVNLVEAIINKHKPAILYIDGAYLLTDETSDATRVYQNMAGVVRRLKRLTKQYRTPIIVTWQFNRTVKDGAEGSFGNAAGTDALAQDCDVYISLSAAEDQKEMGTAVLSTPGSRACPPFRVNINFSPESGDFSEILESDNQEVYTGDL